MKINPLRNIVILEAEQSEEVTKSGIIVPGKEKEAPIIGTVAFAGPASTIAVGTKVLFKKYVPDEIELDGKKYLVAEDEDILAIL